MASARTAGQARHPRPPTVATPAPRVRSSGAAPPLCWGWSPLRLPLPGHPPRRPHRPARRVGSGEGLKGASPDENPRPRAAVSRVYGCSLVGLCSGPVRMGGAEGRCTHEEDQDPQGWVGPPDGVGLSSVPRQALGRCMGCGRRVVRTPHPHAARTTPGRSTCVGHRSPL
jgi:hypothetical protein